MTPRNITAGLALTAALAIAPVAAQGASPAVERIAPGGNISSVDKASEVHGWPHFPTDREMIDVARLVLVSYAPQGTTARTSCRFGVFMGKARCSLTVNRRHFAVSVKVWEDGSYRMTRKSARPS